MRSAIAWLAGAVLVLLSIAPGLAHSLQDLEGQLHAREKYFQPLDRPAPAFRLQDADGRTVSLSDLRDKVVILNFVYTHCPDVCPLHAEKIAEIQRMVNETPMCDRVRFVTITTDPVRDTAQILRDYGPAHGLRPTNWVFLTSGADHPEDTRRLASAFGHSFTPTDDGMQMHGVVTHVIDREGRLRANFHGLQFEPSSLILFVNALTNDVHRPRESASPHPLWGRVQTLFGRRE